MNPLSQEELFRYSRHFTIPMVGEAGQNILKKSRVLCVGAGGLGSPVLLYLTAAGLGTIGIIDDDKIELSNLQRQVLYDCQELQKPKITAAHEKLRKLNPHLDFILYNQRLTQGNAQEIIDDFDIIIDCTDNFASRYIINDACFYAKKPHVYASVFQFEGQCAVFDATKGPCYRCLFAEPPPLGFAPGSSEIGILGILPGVMGAMQAAETIKLILGIGEPLIGRLLSFDALKMSFKILPIAKNENCILCGQNYTNITS